MSPKMDSKDREILSVKILELKCQVLDIARIRIEQLRQERYARLPIRHAGKTECTGYLIALDDMDVMLKELSAPWKDNITLILTQMKDKP